MAGSPVSQTHKLCGFLRAVLYVSPSQPDGISDAAHLGPGNRCELFGDGSFVGFRSENSGFLLLPIHNSASFTSKSGQESNSVQSSVIPRPDGVEVTAPRRRGRRKGRPDRTISVVHEIHTLKANKCLETDARILRILARDGMVRAILLIDIYLPMAVWSGWQFPKTGKMAASLFQHLSCNWEERKSHIVCDSNTYAHGDEEWVWNHPDCHVLGCRVHYNALDSTKRKAFELHEIFKSLPTVDKEEKVCSARVTPALLSCGSGLWDLSDDLLTYILAVLGPKDLIRVAATCHHIWSLAAPIMPCLKLKLFPHQQAAVEWMLQREHNNRVLPHPLYMDFSTEDGFHFYIHAVSGEVLTGVAPTVTDFHGGMFCDEPGLGKTITALSLVLKTQGMWAEPPEGVEVTRCLHNSSQRCGYYEISSDRFSHGCFMSKWKRIIGQNGRGKRVCPDMLSSECNVSGKTMSSSSRSENIAGSDLLTSCTVSPFCHTIESHMRVRCSTRNMSGMKRNLFESFERNSALTKKKIKMNSTRQTHKPNGFSDDHVTGEVHKYPDLPVSYIKTKKVNSGHETWVQCDACSKWRKLSDGTLLDANAAWFCSMNTDQFHQSCAVSEEYWDYRRSITDLPGFITKGMQLGKEQNVSFFENVLKAHCKSINSETKKALTWLANLSASKLAEMETVGLRPPVVDTQISTSGDQNAYHKIFQAFGLVRRVDRGMNRWYYPRTLVNNLTFDSAALRIALTKPLNIFRLYLSKATLIVVPSNLVDHWRTQILSHVKPGQLHIFCWTDSKILPAHNLAWDYDIVITTFNRLSAEWGPHKRSTMMQIHWLRVILDEGHTLGSSLSLTNKLQMAISLAATNRWLLTGTPAPNTPNSHVSHLHPMLKFLHEEAYGQNQKAWEAAILRPFEAHMIEGRTRLLELLHRCMISARKNDLRSIPPCVKKVTFLEFTENHAKSYNELVVTVRRNILMADWNDPSHVESLLNPKQWKFRANTIRNVRLSCCVAGHIKVTDAGHDIQETMDILVEHGLDADSEEYAVIKSSLLYGGDCFRCGEWCRLPIITPCRHLLCLDCVALDSRGCTFPGCGNSYEMQNPESLARPENPNPKWPVPKDLIELQPSYKQDDWDPDWHATSSSKVAYLVERLKTLHEPNRKMGYFSDASNAMNTLSVVQLLSDNSHPVMAVKRGACAGFSESLYNIFPEKAIIFSQFLEHIHVIEQQLTGAGVKFVGMYSPMHASNKMKSLKTFQDDSSCTALLMDGSAALGLDLSFVTHVFLMEPIWDRSVEEQVISRAHRMGATRPIHVETLAMRGTVEDQMIQLLQDADKFGGTLRQELCNDDHELARPYRSLHDFAESNYLARLSFVHTSIAL